MDNRPAPSAPPSIAAAPGWWREAGVDLAFTDEPHAWLATMRTARRTPAPQAAAVPAARLPRRRRRRSAATAPGWPQDLARFARWWLEEPSLDHGGTPPADRPAQAGAQHR